MFGFGERGARQGDDDKSRERWSCGAPISRLVDGLERDGERGGGGVGGVLAGAFERLVTSRDGVDVQVEVRRVAVRVEARASASRRHEAGVEGVGGGEDAVDDGADLLARASATARGLTDREGTAEARAHASRRPRRSRGHSAIFAASLSASAAASLGSNPYVVVSAWNASRTSSWNAVRTSAEAWSVCACAWYRRRVDSRAEASEPSSGPTALEDAPAEPRVDASPERSSSTSIDTDAAPRRAAPRALPPLLE